ETLAGQIEGAGTLKLVNGALAGGAQIDGGAFALGEFKAEKLAAKIDVANNEAAIDRIAIQLDGSNQVAVTGKMGIVKPFAYAGAQRFRVRAIRSGEHEAAVPDGSARRGEYQHHKARPRKAARELRPEVTGLRRDHRESHRRRHAAPAIRARESKRGAASGRG